MPMTRDQQRCGRCGGTGRFITGSMNGKLTGPGGHCFRCNGKGYQTVSAVKRNQTYDQHAAARAMHSHFH